MATSQIRVPLGGVELEGELEQPVKAAGLVLFAHGSGSSRHSRRNQYVARVLRQAGVGTLLFDLLTAEEERAEALTRHLRFNIDLLADRLVAVTRWVLDQATTRGISIGFFGASTGAAAALVAAAELAESVAAVVSRGGRPDLAGNALDRVRAPTLLIVGGADRTVIQLNEEACSRLHCPKALRIIPGASHLFEEPGTLEIVGRMASEWFSAHFALSHPP